MQYANPRPNGSLTKPKPKPITISKLDQVVVASCLATMANAAQIPGQGYD